MFTGNVCFKNMVIMYVCMYNINESTDKVVFVYGKYLLIPNCKIWA